jgi:hypothetical protein
MAIAKDNITKKAQDKFLEGVTKGLLEMGAEAQPQDKNMFSHKAFKLDTIVGELSITIYTTQRFLFSIYAKFENVNEAKSKFNCNPHSGKFNFNAVYRNGNVSKPVEEALMHFECTQPKNKA